MNSRNNSQVSLLHELLDSLRLNLHSIPDLDTRTLSQSHMDTLEQTLNSQDRMISKYEEIVKKLQLRLIETQLANDEGTKREAQMKNMLSKYMHENTEIKREKIRLETQIEEMQQYSIRQGSSQNDQDAIGVQNDYNILHKAEKELQKCEEKLNICQDCEHHKIVIEELENQNHQQTEIIDKLGQAQEILQMQYKAMELSLDEQSLQEHEEKKKQIQEKLSIKDQNQLENAKEGKENVLQQNNN
eukprot:403346018